MVIKWIWKLTLERWYTIHEKISVPFEFWSKQNDSFSPLFNQLSDVTGHARASKNIFFFDIYRYVCYFAWATELIDMLFIKKVSVSRYRDEIFWPTLVPYAVASEDKSMLMEDSCRPYHANLADGFLFEKQIARME